MKTMKRFTMLIVLAITAGSGRIYSQVTWNAQYMGRTEYRHGFQTLATDNMKPGVFLSQRARLGLKYQAEKFRIGVNIQDVRTWGSQANGTIDVGGLLSVHEAWGELLFNKKMSLKLGRQEIAYDEDRIFGTLDWAMQARRHDAGIFKYQDSLNTLHAGFAYNQDKEQNSGTIYNVANNYKTFQYLYYARQIKDFNLSALFLNNGLQWKTLDSLGNVDTSGVRFSQTAGVRGAYKKGKFGANATFYYTMGKDVNDKDLSAYEASAEVSYEFVKGLKGVLGFEMLSGTSQTDTANKANKSFNPFYGTNHRFNGYMDYFYVGNHLNTVGLNDAYLKLVYTKGKFITSAAAHSFMANADVRDFADTTGISAMSSNFGMELDITFLYNIADFVSIQAGYSHMFGTETLQAIKGGSLDANSNWAYLMLMIRPGLAKFPKSGLKM